MATFTHTVARLSLTWLDLGAIVLWLALMAGIWGMVFLISPRFAVAIVVLPLVVGTIATILNALGDVFCRPRYY